VSQQPVALDILFLLGRYAQNIKTGLHVNAIYKELVALGFSRNKNPVIKNINYLEQSGLLETTMCGEQKTIKTLTPLGHEFVKLANDFDKYVQSCSELQDTLDHNFGIENYSDKKVQRSILHNKGWTAEEIEESDHLHLSSERLKSRIISPYEIISVMLIRYIFVLSKIKDNENAKTILNHLMMDKISHQLANTIATNLEDKSINLTEESYKNLISQKTGFVRDHIWENYHFNRFTDTEVSNVLSSLSDVLLTKDYDNEWPYWGLASAIKLLTDPEEEPNRKGKNNRYKTAADPKFFYR
jgi:hypothetical protein